MSIRINPLGTSCITPSPAASVAPPSTVGGASKNEAPAPPLPSGQVPTDIKAIPAVINGLAGGTNESTITSNRWQRDQEFDGFTADEGAAVERGFIRCNVQSIAGGCRLTVDTFHHDFDDQLNLYLLVEVVDNKTGELRPITLSVLANQENINGSSYHGQRVFDIKYADINAFLQARNPHLTIQPGHTTLAVAAKWGSGHDAGGFARGGAFRLPFEAGAVQNAVSVRAAQKTRTEQTDLPLDMQVNYPPALLQDVQELAEDGAIMTRLESELKGTTDRDSLNAAIRTLYEWAAQAAKGDRSCLDRALGEDWSVSFVDRYWLKDDGSPNQPGQPGSGLFTGFRVDQDGLPIQDPMHDQYMDNASLDMTRHEGAVRLRTNKQATEINVKPGGGKRHEQSGITQRVEVGIHLKPGTDVTGAASALRVLDGGDWGGTVFNHAQKQVCALDPRLQLQECLEPWLDVMQDRHKFTVRNNRTGVEVELSLDKVDCSTVRRNLGMPDGSPRRAQFCVVEAELDHMQLSSANARNYVQATNSLSTHFYTDQEQDAWLKSTGADVTTVVEPRLHELADLDNASFRATSSYQQFKEVIGKLVKSLFPQGLGEGRQKSAHAAAVMGLAFPDAEHLSAGFARWVEEEGYQWTPALQTALDAVLVDPAATQNLERALIRGSDRTLLGLVEEHLHVSSSRLEYNPEALVTRVRRMLTSMGFVPTPEVDALVRRLTPDTIPPSKLEDALANMVSCADQDWMVKSGIVLTELCKASGQPQVLVRDDPTGLLDNPVWQSTLLQRLKDTRVDEAVLPTVMDFLRTAVAAGAGLSALRRFASNASFAPQQGLDQLAHQAGLDGRQPRLRVDLATLQQHVWMVMIAHGFRRDASLDVLLQTMVEQCPPEEISAFVLALQQQGASGLASMAGRLGVPAPKPVLDFAALDKTVGTVLSQLCIAYSGPLKDFFHRCAESGVSSIQLQTVLGNLYSCDFNEALKRAGVAVPGLTPPPLEPDVAMIGALIRRSLTTYAWLMPSGPRVEEYIRACANQGMAFHEIATFVTVYLLGGRANCNSVPCPPDLDSLPPLPVDVDAYCHYVQNRLGERYSPELDQYLRSNLLKAIQSPTFALGAVLDWTYPQYALGVFAAATGMPAPQVV